MPVLHVSGPSNSGPGERGEMLAKARAFLERSGVDPSDVIRVDVPPKGSGSDGDTALRGELEAIVPTLQSGSLFGGMQGLEVIDAQNLTAAEAEVIAELVSTMDDDAVALAVVSAGNVPAALAKQLRSRGEVVAVRKLWESSATKWLAQEIEARELAIDSAAAGALIQRFGADTESLRQALDQLSETTGKITAGAVLDRFRNRPNEPIFHYTDAITRGDAAEALRRLGDLLVHQHPLVILASLETELRRRSLVLTAPDIETFRAQAGARGSDKWVERVWRQRNRLKDSGLRRGLEAMVRADRILKSAPEEMHRVTLERLTLAMCRWMVGR
jgi:DNA polymerase III delta subunit